MTELRQQAGIRPRIWIAGRNCIRDPLPVIAPKRFETKTRLSNGALRVDRLFTLDGMPNIRQTLDISLTWADLREAGLLEYVDIIAATGQPFLLGLWKQVYDVFDGDAVTKTFLLQRRQILPLVTPSESHPDFVTQVLTYDKPLTDPTRTETVLTVVPKTSAEILSGDPSSGEAWVENEGHQQGNLWLTTVRLETAPVDDHDVLLVKYLPLLTVVIDTEDQKQYGVALQEGRGYRLVEFG